MFLRKPAITSDPLAVTMSGVRMGERLLQIGGVDAKLAAQLAAKPGISGHAAIVVTNERDAERARAAAAQSGALVDVQSAPIARAVGGRFEVVVCTAPPARLRRSRTGTRQGALGSSVLRGGGRF